MSTKAQYSVYCLKRVDIDGHAANRRKTYVGCTNNLKKRLREHNGEITGGAKSTRGGSWKFMFYVTGFPSRETALSCEKRFHLLRTRDRARGLVTVLSKDRWPRSRGKADIIPSDFDLVLYCNAKDFEGLEIPPYVTVHDLALK
ncbi:putative GIY-YIG endonuclease [Mollivirus sibericum]|uniref:putative GIY-YIG endonuclease n=1 Tax=Mollivirus sibericum TaxID=1678078 RepID=UPI0006B2EF06|nr:putative GIY-YIG endonuclease [Mollivirus sibericum]ALD61945.1 putative GIY-YIG endonuclease [Mollivirus sibericum]